jgi:phosphoribosyl-ATP pyrophosphohydrolase/phosphoribosyl-AMP cyclohydrolase
MILDSIDALDDVAFNTDSGLVTIVAQHAVTGEVLMVAHANREALTRSIRDRVLWLYSRSRSSLWKKGETSGNVMNVVELRSDCDGDAVVALVAPQGPACHTGARTCFNARPTLVMLADTIAQRAAELSGESVSYTKRLLKDQNLRAKKLGEEAVELALACAAGDKDAAALEGADLIFHTLVACFAAGASLADVVAVLENRSERAASSEE